MMPPSSPQPSEDGLRTENWLYEEGPRGNPREFVNRYYSLIEEWAGRLVHCSGAPIDCKDVAQEVIAKLLSRGDWSFQRERGQFRGFLFRVVQNAVRDRLRERRRGDCGAGGDKDVLAAIPDQSWDELTDKLDAQWQRDSPQILRLVEGVRARVTPVTWDAFYLSVVQGLKGSDVVARLNLGTASKVYNARRRVVVMLLADLATLGLEEEALRRHLVGALRLTHSPTAPTVAP